MPEHAAITFIQVADLDRSHRFYADTLGLELTTDQGACRIYRVGPGGFIGVCNHAGPPSPDGVILTIVRDDTEAFCAALEAGGVVFEKPIGHSPRFGITQAFLRDPDGYLVEIQRFDDPAWSDPL